MGGEKQRKNNSYTKVFSIYLWICIAGLILSIPLFNALINKHDLEISNDMCGLIAEKMNNSITYITESVKGRAEILSGSNIEKWNEIYDNLEENLDAEGCNSIGILRRNGELIGKVNEDQEFEKWGLKEQAMNSKGVFFSAPYRQGSSGKMVFTIFSPLYQKRARVGYLYMTYDLEEIQKMANSEILKDSMDIYLMNPYSNNYISCFGADSSQLGSWNNTKLLYGQIETTKGKTYTEWLDAMIDGRDGEVIFFKMNNILYTQVFVNINVMEDWSVVVRVPNDALSYNLRFFHMIVIMVIVILIISLFVLFILANRNANEEKKILEHLSIHDPLTQLANRRAFEDMYNNYLIERTDSSRKGALIFFDIDYFKQVNDGYGHAMGDKVLVDFANLASEIFEQNGIVSRFGGDEFVLLIQVLDSRELVEKQLEEFRKNLRELDYLVSSDGKIFKIHFSAGIVEVSGVNNSLEEVERKADKALYQVKQRGRDGFAWYE